MCDKSPLVILNGYKGVFVASLGGGRHHRGHSAGDSPGQQTLTSQA